MKRLLALLALVALCGCADTHEWIPWSAEVRSWCDAQMWFVPVERCEECGRVRYDESRQWRYEE